MNDTRNPLHVESTVETYNCKRGMITGSTNTTIYTNSTYNESKNTTVYTNHTYNESKNTTVYTYCTYNENENTTVYRLVMKVKSLALL